MPDPIGHLITKYLRRHPFEGVSFFVVRLRGQKNAPFSGQSCQFALRVQEKALFYGRCHRLQHHIHENAYSRG